MGDLSKHFNRAEFACQCGCGFNTADFSLVMLLEEVREHFGRPVTITSGCRCRRHNLIVGGKSHSQHTIGRAADIQVAGVRPKDVQDWLEDRHNGGMGSYDNFTHLDTRLVFTRWSG